MALIVVALALYAIIKTISVVCQRSRERRIREEQARLREELRREQREAREARAEQVRQAREIEKHDAWLKKHDAEIADLKYRMGKVEADIAHWKNQVNELYALLDYELLEQAGCTNGSREFVKHQNKVITLQNKIHSAEAKLAKAEHEKDKLSA